jgi:O-methyltransferase involved in polyketide biosynthesis
MTEQRDYSTISSSAKAVLLVKAQTSLPFAKEAAELLFGEAARTKAPVDERRKAHFELRARSLDAALEECGIRQILEIAAGLSFRGLALAANENVTYVDSDLPEMAVIKAKLVPQLHATPLKGTLTLRALNALDADAFRNVVAEIPAGELAIIHEGLLMYLDEEEKKRLAASVREALKSRGGAWITADIYVQSETHLHRDEKLQKFLADHRVEDNKFADWNAAEKFFTDNGFVIEKRHTPNSDSSRVRETWTLRAR